MLGSMVAWKPSQVTPTPDKDDKYWNDWAPDDENNTLEGYVV
jgi:hypothetical protein